MKQIPHKYIQWLEFDQDAKATLTPSHITFYIPKKKVKPLELNRGKFYYTILPYWDNMLLKVKIIKIKFISDHTQGLPYGYQAWELLDVKGEVI